jgi:hypothetical protein
MAVTSAAMPRTKTVALDSHAAATLQYIRSTMDAAVSLSIPGSAGIAMGTVGLVAAVVASAPGVREHWLIVWLAAAAVAATLAGVRLARQASRQGFTLFGAPVRKLALCLFPGLFAGAAMTGVLWTAGDLHAIPGSWLLLYGCALVSASAPTTRMIGILGVLFAALGLAAFALPDRWQMATLGAGFGGLHLLFGVLIGRSE